MQPNSFPSRQSDKIHPNFVSLHHWPDVIPSFNKVLILISPLTQRFYKPMLRLIFQFSRLHSISSFALFCCLSSQLLVKVEQQQQMKIGLYVNEIRWLHNKIFKYLSLCLPLHMFVDSPSTTTLGVQFSSLSVAFIGTQYNPHVCCLVMACVSLPVRVLCFAEFSGTLPANFNFFCCYLRLAATFLCSVWDSFSETNWLYDGDWLDWQYGKKNFCLLPLIFTT